MHGSTLSQRFGFLLLVGASFAVAGCGGGGGGGGGSSGAPRAIKFGRNPAIYARNLAIAANTPTHSGSPATNWSIAPALPVGLVMDPATGVVSGTPTDLVPRTSYAVTATNASGFGTATLELSVVRGGALAIGSDTGDETLALFGVDAGTGKLRPLSYVKTGATELSPRGMLPSRNGEAFYALDFASSKISVYDVDRSAGRILPRTTVATGAEPTMMVLHPTANVAYLLCRGGASLTTFAVDPLTGDLTQQGAPLATGTTPESIAIDDAGEFLYVGNRGDSTISTFSIDGTTHLPSPTGAPLALPQAPLSLASGRDGAFLYAVLTNNVSILSVDGLTGLPSLVSSITAGTAPLRLAVEPTGRFLYVAVSGDDAVRAFSIHPTTGLLTLIGGPVPAGDRPVSLSVDPTGQFLYATDANSNEITIFRINPISGSLTAVESCRSRRDPFQLAFLPADEPISPLSAFVYVANGSTHDVSMYTVDPGTGALAENLPTIPAGTQPRGVAVDPFGRFAFVVSSGSQDVSAYTIDSGSGLLTSVGLPVAAGTDPRALAVEPSGRFLYVANFGSDNVTAFSIDATTGELTSIGAFGAGSGPHGIIVDPTGRFAYVANNTGNTLTGFTIDVSSGALTAFATAAPANGKPRGLACNANGRVLYTTFENVNIAASYTINGIDGTLILLNTRFTGVQPTAIALDTLGRFAYATNRDPLNVGGLTRFTIGKKGGLKSVGSALAGTNPIAAVVDPSMRFLYVANEGGDDLSTFSIGTAGALSLPTATQSGVAPSSIAIVGRLQ